MTHLVLRTKNDWKAIHSDSFIFSFFYCFSVPLFFTATLPAFFFFCASAYVVSKELSLQRTGELQPCRWDIFGILWKDAVCCSRNNWQESMTTFLYVFEHIFKDDSNAWHCFSAKVCEFIYKFGSLWLLFWLCQKSTFIKAMQSRSFHCLNCLCLWLWRKISRGLQTYHPECFPRAFKSCI